MDGAHDCRFLPAEFSTIPTEKRIIGSNAVDDAERASAYKAGVFRRGGVTIAISTEGRAPALAGLLREGLEAVVPEDRESWVATARELRQSQTSGRRSDDRAAPAAARRAQPALRDQRRRGRNGDMSGFVALIGPGPGDPELLTVRATRRLAEADLVLSDALVPAAMLDLAPKARQGSPRRPREPERRRRHARRLHQNAVVSALH